MVKRRGAARGVTYLLLLLGVAIVSGTLAAGTSVWSQAQRRERETQLLWAGDQIRRAIAAYARYGADSGSQYPDTLQDLLLDPRSPAPRRFLRRLYDDPMTGSPDWALIRNPQGRIVGVHSRSAGVPLKTGRFVAADAGFEQAATYADWRFTVLPELRRVERPASAAASAAAPPLPFLGSVVHPRPAQDADQDQDKDGEVDERHHAEGQ